MLTCFSIVSNLKPSKFWETEWLLKKSLHKFTDSDYPSNNRRSKGKEFRGNITIRRYLQGIRFYIQTKDEARWSSQRNCYNCNKALQKQETNGDIHFFNIVIGVLQGDTLPSYLFILCLECIQRTLIDR